MTTNSINLNQSAAVAGLGTTTFNITTAGPYTLGFKSFIPYLKDGPLPSALPSPEVTNVTCVADTAGSLNSTFFTFNSAQDFAKFYVWYNINSAGVDPAPAGRTGIAVAAATGATANTIASNTRTAIAANATAALYFTVTGATSHVILNNIQYGDATDAADGTAAPGFSYSITQGSAGTPAQSELVVTLKQNSTVLGTFGMPNASTPLIGAKVPITAAANDVITVVLSSLSTADNQPNAVKTIVNLFQGV